MAAFGVLVTKKDQTLANLSCVSPRQGLFSKSSTRIAKPSLMKRKIRWTRGSIQ